MARIIQYADDWRQRWDNFVEASRNGTFLFKRGYVEYHADRFPDHSLIILDDDSDDIIALLPATASGTTISTHNGLTYGGLIVADSTSAVTVLDVMQLVARHLADEGFQTLIYKPVPHIFHRHPSDDDLYALFRLGAKLTVRNLASAIDLQPAPIPSSRLGKRAAKRARRFDISVQPTRRVDDFWQIIVDDRRLRHNVSPVHSAAEMQLLADRFPDNILMFVARSQGEIVAGAVIYWDRGVMHLQYAAANDRGKETYAVDVIYHHLIYELLRDARYFDLGTSNENAGRWLNRGMVAHKEEFGARSVAFDTYTLNLADLPRP